MLGPWTLAASLELARGEKALADEGAVRDLAASLSEGVTAHLADVRRRLPGVSRLVVQVDEPLLAAVLAGELPTQSGWGRLRAMEEPVVADALGQVLAAAGEHAGVWTSGAPAPLAVIRRAGARFLGVDADMLASLPEDDLGEALEDGMGLLAGVVPVEEDDAAPASVLEPLRRLWRRLGPAPDRLPQAVALTPVDGLELLPPRRRPPSCAAGPSSGGSWRRPAATTQAEASGCGLPGGGARSGIRGGRGARLAPTCPRPAPPPLSRATVAWSPRSPATDLGRASGTGTACRAER